MYETNGRGGGRRLSLSGGGECHGMRCLDDRFEILPSSCLLAVDGGGMRMVYY